jgi:glycosyltransferase involved in cell wall biosynthesis
MRACPAATSMTTPVILGPESELHAGIHGELIVSPPSGVTYYLPQHRHRYLFKAQSDRERDPFREFSVSETVEFALPRGGRAIVHSSRVPVFNRTPWLADMDCLLATLTCGTAFVIGSGGHVRGEAQLRQLRHRLMLLHYLTDDCVGLLFRTEYARRNLLGFVRDLDLLGESDSERLAAKTDVLRPTLRHRPPSGEKDSTTVIVYMGRYATGKGGDVALEVFRRISARHAKPVRLVYVGPLPSEDCTLPREISYHPMLDRESFLELLARGHIFLSPTESESYGFGLVEAASCGLALVTSRGPLMRHIEELFQPDKNAVFISSGGTFESQVDAYEHAVRSLIADENRLRAFRTNNLELFRTGPLSIEAHHRKLLGYYDRMLDRLGATSRGVPEQSAQFAQEFGLELKILGAAEWQRRRRLEGNDSKRFLIG